MQIFTPMISNYIIFKPTFLKPKNIFNRPILSQFKKNHKKEKNKTKKQLKNNKKMRKQWENILERKYLIEVKNKRC